MLAPSFIQELLLLLLFVVVCFDVAKPPDDVHQELSSSSSSLPVGESGVGPSSSESKKVTALPSPLTGLQQLSLPSDLLTPSCSRALELETAFHFCSSSGSKRRHRKDEGKPGTSGVLALLLLLLLLLFLLLLGDCEELCGAPAQLPLLTLSIVSALLPMLLVVLLPPLLLAPLLL